MTANFGRRKANENWTSAGKWAIFAWPLLGWPVENGIEYITYKFGAESPVAFILFFDKKGKFFMYNTISKYYICDKHSLSF